MKNKTLWKVIKVVVIISLLIIATLEIKAYLFPFYKKETRISNIKEKKQDNTEDVLGWIRVQGTNIDYPIIKKTHLEDESSYNYTWMRYHTESIQNRMAIFGHNIQNVSRYPLIGNKNHTRFEQLLSFVYTDFAKENQYIQLTIGKHDYLYRIYAVYFIKETDTGNNLLKKDLASYIKKAKANSYFDFDVDVNENDKLLTLITCTRFFGPTTDYEFKLEGRLVRKFEKVKQNKVTETKQYQEIKKILKEGEKNAEI